MSLTGHHISGYLSHRRMRVSSSWGGGGADVSCLNIFSIACPEIKWFCPIITCFFCPKMAIKEILEPPPPHPPRMPMISLIWLRFCSIYCLFFCSFPLKFLLKTKVKLKCLNFCFISFISISRKPENMAVCYKYCSNTL